MGVTFSRLLLDQEPPSSLQDRAAEDFELIRPFPVEDSGRLSRSFLVQLDGVKAVVKAVWIATHNSNSSDTNNDSSSNASNNWLQDQVRTLQQLQQDNVSCVAAYSHWRLSTYNSNNNGTVRVAYAIRPHCYTVLADRLLSRPWLLDVEKLYLVHQFLSALAALHATSTCHGALTTHNIGLSADGTRLWLLDVGTFRDTTFPDNDPALYHRWGSARWSVAPERFYTPGENRATTAAAAASTTTPLTPAMDIWSAGCIIAEMFVGESSVAEWTTTEPPPFLFKIESSAIRAAVKHMLSRDRWSDAQRYVQRLPPLPQCLFVKESSTAERSSTSHPDARLAAAAQAYPTVLKECLGMETENAVYFDTVLGPAIVQRNASDHESTPPSEEKPSVSNSKQAPTAEQDAAFEKVQSLLDGLQDSTSSSSKKSSKDNDSDYLAIYLQRILANIRHAQRVSSKLVGLQLIRAVSQYTSDTVRLERIVPVVVSLLSDADAQVRAVAVTVLTAVVSLVEQFAPSDSKLFPEYLFKRVGMLASDPSWLVRAAFAKCLALLAVASLKFCNVSHAVRLHEAVASARDSAEPSSTSSSPTKSSSSAVFAANVADLLEPAESKTTTSTTTTTAPSSLLIPGQYQKELDQLFEFVSHWVIQIATDSSSSWPKRALLSECSRLCLFFGFDHIVTFLLPQLLTFFNVRDLRADLFDHLPEICQSIGRGATEEYVLAIVEVGLVDESETVVTSCLRCLSRLVQLGLLVVVSRRWEAYGALLVHPSRAVREPAMDVFANLCQSAGSPDCEVYLVPMLLPFLRFQPTVALILGTVEGMRRVVKQSWDREKWNKYLGDLVIAERNRSVGTWTSVGIVSDDGSNTEKPSQEESVPLSSEQEEERSVRLYLRLLARHIRTETQPTNGLVNGIEGSLKLAQSIMFPRQNGRYRKTWLPNWYAALLQEEETDKPTGISSQAMIRSVSALGHVYGLSIMGPNEGVNENVVVGVPDESQRSDGTGDSQKLPENDVELVEAAFGGEWGAESMVDADVVDTCMLVTKLKGLGVPPLAVKLGDPAAFATQGRDSATVGSSPSGSDSRPRVKGLLATSTKNTGHTAPVMRLAVSIDQKFFVSGSHDGTCRIWEIPEQPDQMAGLLQSKATYSAHIQDQSVKVNDVAMLEGTHSVVSGDNMGNVHVWRVDLQSSSFTTPLQGRFENNKQTERTRIVGTCSVHKSNPDEGEILSVSHFNTSSACVVTYATQKGKIHSWDLRASKEPFQLHHTPEIGYLTSMALGSDRNWLVTGTRQGYMALWDLRYQQCVKLWRHSRETSISRLATSMVSPPQTWGTQGSLANARPFIFASSGNNECAMFDVLTNTCSECFRTIDAGGRIDHSNVEEPPTLVPVPIKSNQRNGFLKPSRLTPPVKFLPTVGSLNCMVGSIGAGQNSYLVTGGSDGRIRLWDFMTPSKCYVVSGQPPLQPRPSFERIDFGGSGEGPPARRLMLCRESHAYKGQQHFHGIQKPDHSHTDSIQDLKVVDTSLVSCSRDCTVKVWR